MPSRCETETRLPPADDDDRAIERPPRLAGFRLPRERAVAKLAAGTPLLHDEPLRLDLAFATERLLRLADALAERELDRQARARAIREAVVSGDRLDAERLVTEAFVQHTDHLAQLASFAGLDAGLLSMLAGQAVAPLRYAYARRLQPLVEQLGGWERGYCPVCGAWPARDDTRPSHATRFLRCSACGLAWRSSSGCPSAGAAQPEATGFRIELALPEGEWEGGW